MAQTATTTLKPLPTPDMQWFDPKSGRPTQSFALYMTALDGILRAGMLGALVNAANDAAAAAAGIPIGGLYRTTNAVQVRLV